MSRKAGRAKTRKAVSKRFKVTGTGLLVRNKPGRRHLLQCKNRKRKRNLRKSVVVAAVDAPRIRASMPFM
ncbi:MAG TPA: 50S ribosomal protein L35 [Verrucomicrobiales bacterium]|nr:50S ribosomal protein L35 [Verrucomicrobiales bacterium]